MAKIGPPEVQYKKLADGMSKLSPELQLAWIRDFLNNYDRSSLVIGWIVDQVNEGLTAYEQSKSVPASSEPSEQFPKDEANSQPTAQSSLPKDALESKKHEPSASYNPLPKEAESIAPLTISEAIDKARGHLNPEAIKPRHPLTKTVDGTPFTDEEFISFAQGYDVTVETIPEAIIVLKRQGYEVGDYRPADKAFA